MSTPGRILIADDDPSARTLVADCLSRAGFACDSVASGLEVAAGLQAKTYDLLVADIEMPGNQDLELIQRLPQLQAGLPVILMTGFPSVPSAVRSVGLSVAAYLIKPFEPEQLVAEVRKAIERYQFYQTVLQARQRLQTACADLARLETCLQRPTGETAGDYAQAFLEVTRHNIAASLQDWRRLTETVSPQSSDDPRAPGPKPAPSTALMSALWETVAVLEKTRVSFKSKELGELRRKLENLLNQEPHR